jgi:membrane protein YqaA with SNARE-associated domain
MIRTALLKTVIAVIIALIVMAALGFAFEDELTAFAQWVADRLGFVGLAAVLMVTDTFVTPFPPDVLLLVVAKSTMGQDWVFYVGLLGFVSAWAGMQGWAIGRWLGHCEPVRRMFGDFKDEHEASLKKYGIWAVLAGAVTPMPFSVTCWTAGMLGMSFWPMLLACLFRVPRFYVYYGIVVTGVSMFNGPV